MMKEKAFPTPDWLARSAVLQINPRTFTPEGTLNSVTRELPALRKMGFRIVYLCPVFPADPSEDRQYWSERQKKYKTENPKNPYRMNTYFGVDEEYGSMEDLRNLTSAAHALGMRVILDLVYYHIGPNAPILKIHPEFARHDADGKISMGYWHFPILNYDAPGLREYLWCNMVYYISEVDADGFRCDVGDNVPLDFWSEGLRRMRAVKPDAVLINEGMNPEYLTKAFQSCYCFSWHETVYSVISGKEPVSALRAKWEELNPNFPEGTLFLRDMDNHDTVTDWPERAEKVCGHRGMETVEVLNYLLDGIPMVYGGNELGDTARINMFANRFYPGTYEFTDRRALEKEAFSQRRQQVMQILNDLKAASDTLRFGSTRWLDHDRPEEVAAFARLYQGEEIRFYGNFTSHEVVLTPAEELTGEVMMPAEECAYTEGKLTLPAWGYVILFGRREME